MIALRGNALHCGGVKYGILFGGTGKLFAFNAGNISLVVQITYYWISSVWTLKHHLMPHHFRLAERDQKCCSVSEIKALSSAQQLIDFDSKTPKKYIGFSIFYTAAVTFPSLVAGIYWLSLFHPDPATIHHGFRIYPNVVTVNYAPFSINETFLHYFMLLNVYGVSALVALLEIMILSNARPQKPLAAHIEAHLVITIGHMMWAVLGKLMTGEYVYQSLDPEYAGWRALVYRDLGVLWYAMFAFSTQWGLHGLKEELSQGAHRRQLRQPEPPENPVLCKRLDTLDA